MNLYQIHIFGPCGPIWILDLILWPWGNEDQFDIPWKKKIWQWIRHINFLCWNLLYIMSALCIQKFENKLIIESNWILHFDVCYTVDIQKIPFVIVYIPSHCFIWYLIRKMPRLYVVYLLTSKWVLRTLVEIHNNCILLNMIGYKRPWEHVKY